MLIFVIQDRLNISRGPCFPHFNTIRYNCQVAEEVLVWHLDTKRSLLTDVSHHFFYVSFTSGI